MDTSGASSAAETCAEWLRNKLGADDGWSAHHIVPQLNAETISRIREAFPLLTDNIKRKVLLALLALLAVPRSAADPLCRSMEALIETASNDADDWVKNISQILRDFPNDNQLQTDISSTSAIFNDAVQLIQNAMHDHDPSDEPLPLREALYLNTELLDHPAPANPHFKLRKPLHPAHISMATPAARRTSALPISRKSGAAAASGGGMQPLRTSLSGARRPSSSTHSGGPGRAAQPSLARAKSRRELLERGIQVEASGSRLKTLNLGDMKQMQLDREAKRRKKDPSSAEAVSAAIAATSSLGTGGTPQATGAAMPPAGSATAAPPAPSLDTAPPQQPAAAAAAVPQYSEDAPMPPASTSSVLSAAAAALAAARAVTTSAEPAIPASAAPPQHAGYPAQMPAASSAHPNAIPPSVMPSYASAPYGAGMVRGPDSGASMNDMMSQVFGGGASQGGAPAAASSASAPMHTPMATSSMPNPYSMSSMPGRSMPASMPAASSAPSASAAASGPATVPVAATISAAELKEVFANTNKLSMRDRKFIVDFMNKEITRGPEDSAKKIIVMNEETRDGEAPNQKIVEQIVLELHWDGYQMKRKRRQKTIRL
eukprot:m.305000 g.305000  ORF g.305000 m.305000 type:complete len:602 (+) comp17434_c0_seq1:73-1878(+)